MALSYEFSIGSVRAKENALFSKTDLEQLLGCKTTAELCQTLSDKGYGTVGAFDEMTKRHMDGVWEYLRRIAPDFGVFAPQADDRRRGAPDHEGPAGMAAGACRHGV